jgi:hypothetical protein
MRGRFVGVVGMAVVLSACGGEYVQESAPRGWLKFKGGETVDCTIGLMRVIVRQSDGMPVAWQYVCRQRDGVMKFNAHDVATAKLMYEPARPTEGQR